MHIHILGICGTFMGGVAVLARQLGHVVTGSDLNVYPPMSTLLSSQDIDIIAGFDPKQLQPHPDLVIIGNAISRGNPCVEYILNHNIKYISGAQWLHDFVLRERWVLAIAGTHGKTTTSSMLTWILECCNYQAGFLVGGVLGNLGVSARLGSSDFFVIEADEYDTAFFDKRSKFVHYHPKTLILNNLEFDHADIFENLAAIKQQFHHLVRTVPSSGLILAPKSDQPLGDVLEQGCWTPVQYLGTSQEWKARKDAPDCSSFTIFHKKQEVGRINWDLIGEHNMHNALMAIAAARHVGVLPENSCLALKAFINTKRRLEKKGEIAGITIYDDFAHHPTAISYTLAGLKNKLTSLNDPNHRILAVLEPRSATMKLGIHKHTLANSLKDSDHIFLYKPPHLNWSLDEVAKQCRGDANVYDSVDKLIVNILASVQTGDHIVIMSNGGFNNIHEKLLTAISAKFS